jgi:predicted aspartyl protease
VRGAPFLTVWLGGIWLAAVALPAAAFPPATGGWPELARPQFPPSAPALPSPDTALFASRTQLDQIGRIIVPVMLNGQGPFRFIVDTGASHSTISPRAAAALGLVPPADALVAVNGITGTDELPAVPIERLQAGDLVIQNTRLPVISAPMLANSDGILGAAGLTNERILVDFLHDRVLITRSHGAGAVADFVRIPARRVRGGLIMVRVLIGRVAANAVIDTGSERTLGNLALRDALHARGAVDTIALTTPVYGATSQVSTGEVAIAPVIALGPARLAHLAVVFGGFHIFKLWNLEREPALILGMDALGTLEGLSIDFASGDLYVRSPDMDNSGVIVSHNTAY